MSQLKFMLLSTLAANSAAVNYGPISGWRDSALDELDSDAQGVIIAANTNPTATRSVNFRPFEKYWDSLAKASILRDSQWTWRINTSDVTAPNADQGETKDPHVASTVYDFTWPDGNFSEALDGATGTFCMATLTSIDLPVSVINKYTEESVNSTNCVPMLGQECVESLLSASGGAVTISDDGHVCIPPSKSWNKLPGCQSSIGNATVYSMLTGDYPLGGVNPLNNATASPWDSGEGFFVNVSAPLNGSLSNGYLESVNRLHVLMINTRLPAGADGDFVGGPELHCMRVNATKLPERDVDGNGVAMTSENIRSVGASIGKYGLSCSIAASTLIAILFTFM